MIERKTEVPNAKPLTYGEHCKQLDALAGPGMEALDEPGKARQ